MSAPTATSVNASQNSNMQMRPSLNVNNQAPFYHPGNTSRFNRPVQRNFHLEGQRLIHHNTNANGHQSYTLYVDAPGQSVYNHYPNLATLPQPSYFTIPQFIPHPIPTVTNLMTAAGPSGTVLTPQWPPAGMTPMFTTQTSTGQLPNQTIVHFPTTGATPQAPPPQQAPVVYGAPVVSMPHQQASHGAQTIMTSSQQPQITQPSPLMTAAQLQQQTGQNQELLKAPKRERNILKIVDPNTQQDIIAELIEEKKKHMEEAEKHAAPQSQGGSSFRGMVLYPPAQLQQQTQVPAQVPLQQVAVGTSTLQHSQAQVQQQEDQPSAQGGLRLTPRSQTPAVDDLQTQQTSDEAQRNQIYSQFALGIAQAATPVIAGTVKSPVQTDQKSQSPQIEPKTHQKTPDKQTATGAGTGEEFSFGFFDDSPKPGQRPLGSKVDQAAIISFPSPERPITSVSAVSDECAVKISLSKEESDASSIDSLYSELAQNKLPDSWFFDNPSGRKIYNRNYMILLINSPLLQEKPSGSCDGLSLVYVDMPQLTRIQTLCANARSVNVPIDTSSFSRAGTGSSGFGAGCSGATDFTPTWMRGAGVQTGLKQAPKSGYGGRTSMTRDRREPLRGSQDNRQQQSYGAPVTIIPRMSLNAAEVTLKRAENAWKPLHKTEKDKTPDQIETDKLYRDVKLILNKITPQTFDDLAMDFCQLDHRMNTPARLIGVIDIVFNKVVDEPKFSEIYARLCQKFRDHQQINKPNKPLPGGEALKGFSYQLLIKCQQEFESERSTEAYNKSKLSEIENAKTEEVKKKLQSDLEENLNKYKWRTLGSMRFVGELYKRQLLTRYLAHVCVMSLLNKVDMSGDEETLECLCKLLSTVGKRITEEAAFPDPSKRVPDNCIEVYLLRLKACLVKYQFSKRLQFEVQNLIELKDNNWIPRRGKDTGPKTIQEVHSEAKLEEITKLHELNQMTLPFSGPGGLGGQSRRPSAQMQRGGTGSQTGQQQSQNKPSKQPVPQRISYGNMPAIDDEFTSAAGGRKKSQQGQSSSRSSDVRNSQFGGSGMGRPQYEGRGSAGGAAGRQDNRNVSSQLAGGTFPRLSRFSSNNSSEQKLKPQRTKQQKAEPHTTSTGNRFENLAEVVDDTTIAIPSSSRASSQSRLSSASTVQTGMPFSQAAGGRNDSSSCLGGLSSASVEPQSLRPCAMKPSSKPATATGNKSNTMEEQSISICGQTVSNFDSVGAGSVTKIAKFDVGDVRIGSGGIIKSETASDQSAGSSRDQSLSRRSVTPTDIETDVAQTSAMSDAPCERKLVDTFKEYLSNNMYDEVRTILNQETPQEHLPYFIRYVLDYVIETNEKDRSRFAQLCQKLLHDKCLSKMHLSDGFSMFVQYCLDQGLETDVPKLWEYLGSILGEILYTSHKRKVGVINLADFQRPISDSNEYCQQFLAFVLKYIQKFAILGKNQSDLKDIFTDIFTGESWLNYGFSNEDDVIKFLNKNELEGILSSELRPAANNGALLTSSANLESRLLTTQASKSSLGSTDLNLSRNLESQQTSVLLNKLDCSSFTGRGCQETKNSTATTTTTTNNNNTDNNNNVSDHFDTDLKEKLQSNPIYLKMQLFLQAFRPSSEAEQPRPLESEPIIKWIVENIDAEQYFTEDFACALSYSLLSNVFGGCAKCGTPADAVQPFLEPCFLVFQRFITTHSRLEELLLHTLAYLYYKHSCPKDVLVTVLQSLSLANVLPRETLLEWWDKSNSMGMIMKNNQVKQFFSNLQREYEKDKLLATDQHK